MVVQEALARRFVCGGQVAEACALAHDSAAGCTLQADRLKLADAAPLTGTTSLSRGGSLRILARHLPGVHAVLVSLVCIGQSDCQGLVRPCGASVVCAIWTNPGRSPAHWCPAILLPARAYAPAGPMIVRLSQCRRMMRPP